MLVGFEKYAVTFSFLFVVLSNVNADVNMMHIGTGMLTGMKLS